MQFSATHDLKLTQNDLFKRLTDFEYFEQLARGKGVDLERTSGDAGAAAAGMAWQAVFKLAGKQRQITTTLVEMVAPDTLQFEFSSANMTGRSTVTLDPLSQTQTRLNVEIDLQPQTLSARLFVQSLKLARAQANKRFQGRITRFAQFLENQSV